MIGDLISIYAGQRGRTIVFCEKKREADELAVDPAVTSKVDCKAMHGDVAQVTQSRYNSIFVWCILSSFSVLQGQREATLAAFRSGSLRCIIATDVAARGLDIKGVDLVIQAQPPQGNLSGRADVDTCVRGKYIPSRVVHCFLCCSYVHRSGRTGRAGRKGVCVTMYARNQEHLIGQVRYVASL
jgi:ATP-dependent RNA helicase DDX21